MRRNEEKSTSTSEVLKLAPENAKRPITKRCTDFASLLKALFVAKRTSNRDTWYQVNHMREKNPRYEAIASLRE